MAAVLKQTGAKPRQESQLTRFLVQDGQAAFGEPRETRWLAFGEPLETWTARAPQEVRPLLRAVEAAVEARGLFAGGFLAYDAAPAFDAVARIRAHIARGDTYQVNFTFPLTASFAGDPAAAFLRLVEAQPTACAAFLDLGRWVICSASPELFFERDGTRLRSRPMKGTAARGRTHAEDELQRERLRSSDKDRAENVMIVDMVRNDLGRVADLGSVEVPALFEVERYPTLLQMTSTVCARTHASHEEVLAALFPFASITGAPKIRTMEIITGLEPAPRGIYTGAIGYLAPGRRAS